MTIAREISMEEAVELASAAPVPVRFEAFGRTYVIHLPAHLGEGTATGAHYVDMLATRIRLGFIPDGTASGILAGSYRWAMIDPEPYAWGNIRSEDGDPAGYDFDAVFTFDPRPGFSQNKEDYE